MMIKKSIQKFISFLLVSVMLFSAKAVVFANETTINKNSLDKSCNDLLLQLGTEHNLNGAADSEVTIGDYVATLLKIMQYDDVEDEMEQARSLGIILNDDIQSKDKLTVRYALQMAASALGYNAEVMAQNGDLNTFINIASQIGLTEKVEIPRDNICRTKTALAIINNMLTAPTVMNDLGGFYRDKNNTFLKRYYKVHIIKGTITAVEHTSLFSANGGGGEGNIMLGNARYEYRDSRNINLLGLYAEIYVYNDRDEIVYINPYRRNIVEFTGRDISSFGQNMISYYDKDGRMQKISLLDTYNIIRNGSAYKKSLDDAIEDYSDVRFVDNNADDIYETVFVETPMYMSVSSYSYSNNLLYGEKSEIIDLNCKNLHIVDGYGENVNQEKIKTGTFLKALISDDGEYVYITILDTSVTGSLRSIEEIQSGTKLKIGDAEYYGNEYFNEFFADTVKLNMEYKFFIDQGKIAYVYSGSNLMKYGFYIRSYLTDGEEIPMIRLMMSDGEIRRAELAEKVKLNNNPEKGRDISNLIATPQVIRYKMNNNGKVNVIDTAQNSLQPYDALKADPYNSLVKYDSTESLFYKSGIKNLGGLCTSTPEIIFVVPKNLSTTELKDYGLGSTAIFENDTSYTLGTDIDIYNITEDRTAGVIVSYGSQADMYGDTTATAIVDNIVQCCTDDMVFGYKIDYIMGGVYGSVYVDPTEDVSLNKKSGKMIGSGDWIRFSAKNGYVTSLICDFDAELMKVENSAIPHNSSNTNRQLQLKTGYIYMIKDGRIVLDRTGKTNPEDVEWSDTYMYNIPTSGIILIERQRDKNNNVKKCNIRIIDNSEILTYKNSLADTAYAVMRQSYFATQNLVIYTDMK